MIRKSNIVNYTHSTYTPVAISFVWLWWTPAASETLSYGLNFNILLWVLAPRPLCSNEKHYFAYAIILLVIITHHNFYTTISQRKKDSSYKTLARLFFFLTLIEYFEAIH